MDRLVVFYDDKMIAMSESFSPSAEKPRAVVESWKALPLQIFAPAPATIDELCLAHDATFVKDVLACRARNGFGNRSSAVAASLPFTSGAMLSAARYVLENGGAASAPCSGFHHAGWSEPGGFCTFNGLMVTAAALRAKGRAQKIGILDCDHHFGDGTEDIIKHLNARSWVQHFTAGAAWSRRHQAEEFLRELPAIVRQMADCDLILYQAGADPHLHDPLGGWLTTEQLRRRDQIVFETVQKMGLPIVWNLAGGYQRAPDGGIGPVLEIHLNTAREHCKAFFKNPPAPEPSQYQPAPAAHK